MNNPLAGYAAAHLRCRSDRHRWGRQAAWFIHDADHNERHLVCDDCGCRRVEIININTYEREGWVRYRYPKGYLTPKSGLRLVDFREALLRKDHTRAVMRDEIRPA